MTPLEQELPLPTCTSNRTSRRLCITLVARHYWPAVGGVEVFLRHVARGLADRHDVTVLAQAVDDAPPTRLSGSLAPYPAFEPFTDGGVKVRQLRLSSARRAAMAPLGVQVVPVARRYVNGRARRALSALYAQVIGPVIAEEASGSEIIHVWSGDFLAAGGVRAGLLTGLPTLVTPFVHPGRWNDDPGSAAAYRRAHRVIGLLDADADVLSGLGVAQEHLSVSGVCSPGLPTGGGQTIRDAHDIDGPLVVFLGVRRPYKGFDVLLEAARMLPTSAKRPTIAFIGPGDPIESEQEGARIIDVGRVDDATKAAWLEAADLLCLPSEGEIFPVSILEAWSVGTPVLVSDIPPLRELVERSGGGLPVERRSDALADALLRCFKDPARLAEMGAAGRRAWERNYTIDAVVGWHEREYEGLLGARMSPHESVTVAAPASASDVHESTGQATADSGPPSAPRQTLTAVIPTKNVAHLIEDCLTSVAWADEILVIDMFSTDGTQDICKRWPQCRVIEREDYIFGNVNHGIDEAASDWILRLDSDERLTPELSAEIQGILADPPQNIIGYCCWERPFMLGHELRHGFGRRHHRRILFRKGTARYEVKREHEDLSFDGEWATAKHGYIHLNYRSVGHYLAKMDYYISKDLEREQLPARLPSASRGVITTTRAFYLYYMKYQGFRDGWPGLLDASMRAIYQWVAYAKLRERWEAEHHG